MRDLPSHFSRRTTVFAAALLLQLALVPRAWSTTCFSRFPGNRSQWYLKTLVLYQHYTEDPNSSFKYLVDDPGLVETLGAKFEDFFAICKWGVAMANTEFESAAREPVEASHECLEFPQFGATTLAHAVQFPRVSLKGLKRPDAPVSVLKPLAVSATLPHVTWESDFSPTLRVIIFFTDIAAPEQIALPPPEPIAPTPPDAYTRCDNDEPTPEVLARMLRVHNIALIPVVRQRNAEYWKTTVLRDAGIRGAVAVIPDNHSAVNTVFDTIVDTIKALTCEGQAEWERNQTTSTAAPATSDFPTTNILDHTTEADDAETSTSTIVPAAPPPTSTSPEPSTPTVSEGSPPTVSEEWTPTASEEWTPTASEEWTPTASEEPTPTASEEPTPTVSEGPTPTASEGPTPTASEGSTPTGLEGSTPTVSEGSAPTVSGTAPTVSGTAPTASGSGSAPPPSKSPLIPRAVADPVIQRAPSGAPQTTGIVVKTTGLPGPAPGTTSAARAMEPLQRSRFMMFVPATALAALYVA